MNSRENENAFVISKVMKRGPKFQVGGEICGRVEVRGSFLIALLKKGENGGKRNEISGLLKQNSQHYETRRLKFIY